MPPETLLRLLRNAFGPSEKEQGSRGQRRFRARVLGIAELEPLPLGNFEGQEGWLHMPDAE